jgi:hypothetical protein
MQAATIRRCGDAQMAACFHPCGQHTGIRIGPVGKKALAIFKKRTILRGVGVMRRLVRTSNFTPNRSSSASSLLPMMASQILDLRRSPHVTLVDYGTKSHNLLELIHGVWGLWESAPAFLWCLIFNKIKNGAFF